MNVDKELKRHFIGRMIENERRTDGRSFDEFRPINVETDIINSTAEGSAKVNLGKTEVICGIKMGLMTPWPDNPAEGVMMTGAELSPIASPAFETGPPRPQAIELARVVDRGIRESKMIDLGKLVVTEGELVWSVSIDLHMINDDGNLFDACSFAAVAALRNTWVPKEEDGRVVREKSMDLPIVATPVSSTFAKIGDKILTDPSLDEQFAMDARLTLTTTEKELHAGQKGESGFFSSAEIEDMTEKAFINFKNVNKLLK